MSLTDLLSPFDWSHLGFFVLFALPGFISLQIWSLIVPSSERTFGELLPEALGFGVLNTIVAGPAVVLISPSNPWVLYFTLLVALVGLPALWPFVTKAALKRLHQLGIILNPRRNGWDAAFLPNEERDDERYFVIVHLHDGRRIGGYYGYDSYAGVHPASGHLYLESIWALDEQDRFMEEVERSKGMIFRPEDYHFVELFEADPELDDGR